MEINMKNFLLSFLLITSIGISASTTGVGLSMHNWGDVDSGYGDISFTMPTLNFTYENRMENNLAFQAKVGFGLSEDSDKDDDGDGWDAEIKNTIQLKGMYFLNDSVYAAVTATRYKVEIYSEYFDESASDSSNDFGFLFGYRKDDLELYVGPTYSKGDDGEVVEFGFNYFF
jgi:hypothetical protein